MSSQDQALPAVAGFRTLDDASAWFWRFLKTELAPYPGRTWLAVRITTAATITMLLVMTFRIPYGFLGAIYTLLLSRENPTATFNGAVKTVVVYGITMLYIIVGIMTMVDDPLTHFLWITMSLFLAFYLSHIIRDYFTAIGFGFMLAVAIPLWDETLLAVYQRTEDTLWLGSSVVLGAVVVAAVEYVFRCVNPITYITQAIESRLRAVEDLVRQLAADLPVGSRVEKELSLYSTLGTSKLRRELLTSGYPPELIAQMNVAAALLGRLVDLAASLGIARSTQSVAIGAADRDRCSRLANEISSLRGDLQRRKLPRAIDIASQPEPSDVPLLPEMEKTVALIPHAFSRAKSVKELFPSAPMGAEVRSRLFVPDAFSNLDHLKFAVRGTLATMVAYVFYQAIDWPGLGTSIAACIITGLSTIGSSRQQLFLRMGGTIIGGCVFGMGAQICVLPYLDSITGFTVLFAVVTAITAWILTATPRLSYLGVQLALIFYLINLQEFAPQFSLAIARNRVVGILLGLVSMWLIFDRLWVGDALRKMQDAFSAICGCWLNSLNNRVTTTARKRPGGACSYVIRSMTVSMRLRRNRKPCFLSSGRHVHENSKFVMTSGVGNLPSVSCCSCRSHSWNTFPQGRSQNYPNQSQKHRLPLKKTWPSSPKPSPTTSPERFPPRLPMFKNLLRRCGKRFASTTHNQACQFLQRSAA